MATSTSNPRTWRTMRGWRGSGLGCGTAVTGRHAGCTVCNAAGSGGATGRAVPLLVVPARGAVRPGRLTTVLAWLTAKGGTAATGCEVHCAAGCKSVVETWFAHAKPSCWGRCAMGLAWLAPIVSADVEAGCRCSGAGVAEVWDIQSRRACAVWPPCVVGVKGRKKVAAWRPQAIRHTWRNALDLMRINSDA